MASEAGVLDAPEERITRKWRLEPGRMLLVDLERGRIIDDDELKQEIAAAHPYQAWLDQTQIRIETLPDEVPPMPPPHAVLLDRQQAFGYTQEDICASSCSLDGLVGGATRSAPWGATRRSPRSPTAPKLLFDYFQQRFAQVTNPPIDLTRESLVMSLVSLVGPRPNLLDLETGGKHIRLELHQPILTNVDVEKIRRIEDSCGRRLPHLYAVDLLSRAEQDAAGMAGADRPPSAAIGRGARCAAAQTSSCCPTGRSTPITSRCPRCSRWPRFIII